MQQQKRQLGTMFPIQSMLRVYKEDTDWLAISLELVQL
jgi:hypothetical protein